LVQGVRHLAAFQLDAPPVVVIPGWMTLLCPQEGAVLLGPEIIFLPKHQKSSANFGESSANLIKT
jgi:hypothetical protein